ncbi:MAG: DUF1080 domain-containing protein [Bacteroidota bacterium]|nr:DUF1080 domain-containing protein [Bacteroidota bacterium]
MKNIFLIFLFLIASFYFSSCDRTENEPEPIDEPIGEDPDKPEDPGAEDPDPKDPENPVINLLDNELSYWYKWLGVPHNSVSGLPTGTPTGDGMNGTPLGRQDPKGVFEVIQMEGEAAIKVTGEIYGGLTTNEEYSDYHFKVDYKWGQKSGSPG